MTFVIDASIAASWCFPDERPSAGNRALSRMERESASAPAHWWFEVRNVVLIGERRQRITSDHAEQFLALLSRLPIEIDRSPDEKRILAIARRHGLTFYDAAYLELAQRIGPLATLDDEVVSAARREGIDLV